MFIEITVFDKKNLIISKLIAENLEQKSRISQFEEKLAPFFERNTNSKEEGEQTLLNTKWLNVALDSKKISKNKYADNFTCFDFSKQLRDELTKDNIPSKIDIVKDLKSEKDLHAIVSIQIEPQSGTIVYHNVEDLIDQCTESEKGENVCRKGVIRKKNDGVNVYISNK